MALRRMVGDASGQVLHPAQVASIEAFSYIGLPLCIADLAEIIDDIEAVHLDYHLGRLLKIGALELADAPYAQKEFMEMRYRLRGRDSRWRTIGTRLRCI